MSDRVAQMRIELMNDLYAVMGDPAQIEAIINPADEIVTDATDVAPLYFIDIESKTTGVLKRYDANHLSTSPKRNVFLLQTLLQALLTVTDDAMAASIREFAKAIIDAL